MGARARRVQIISPALAEIMGGRRLCDGVDDLGRVDAVEIDRRHAEVDVAELALDHLQRNTFAGHRAWAWRSWWGVPTSRRLPPLPCRTRIEPRPGSRSGSVSAIASPIRRPAGQSTTISARSRSPWSLLPARRITATISSTRGGSG